MSKENIAKFQEAFAQKPELSEKLKDARTPEALVAAAKAEGFDFTVEELKEYGKAAAPSGMNSGDAAQRELSPEELEKVAGGHHCRFAYTNTCTPQCPLYAKLCFYGYFNAEYDHYRPWWMRLNDPCDDDD